jgi:hypothetical protein
MNTPTLHPPQSIPNKSFSSKSKPLPIETSRRECQKDHPDMGEGEKGKVKGTCFSRPPVSGSHFSVWRSLYFCFPIKAFSVLLLSGLQCFNSLAHRGKGFTTAARWCQIVEERHLNM